MNPFFSVGKRPFPQGLAVPFLSEINVFYIKGVWIEWIAGALNPCSRVKLPDTPPKRTAGGLFPHLEKGSSL